MNYWENFPIPHVRPNSDLSNLTDVQLFYLGRFCMRTIARVLCTFVPWCKEPGQGVSPIECAKAKNQCLFFHYDKALDICELAKDSRNNGPDWY